VMAYVLRVLESYPPERVTFFMPQLVQSLRYDDGVGYLMNLTICAYANTLVQVWLGKP
jgi:phosphatidylinositol 4-kinase